MANNQYVNKVVYGNQTLIDLSEDTVTPETLRSGATAHSASGSPITGEMAPVTVDSELSDSSENPVQNKVVTEALEDKAKVISKIATGSIASFSDGADDLPVIDLTIGIDPVQSGSGDPSPSNVRSISGWNGANVYHEDEYDVGATVALPISWQTEAGTVYGGMLDVTTGLLIVTHGNISSYNGETLPSKWISSMDVYAAGATPTTGAQVVYELAEAQAYQLTPNEIKTLLGNNAIWADTGDTTVKYQTNTELTMRLSEFITNSVDGDFSATGNISAGGTLNATGAANLYGGIGSFGRDCGLLARQMDGVISGTSGNNSVTLTADVPSGYTFLCWIGASSNGWLGLVYPASRLGSTSAFWTNTSGNSGGNRPFRAVYLCFKSTTQS